MEEGDQEATKPEKESTELDKYWKAVRENPADFTGWTYLLQYVEQEVGSSKVLPFFMAVV